MASKPAPGPAFGSSPSSGLQFLNSPFGDTTYTKVFVGGLAWETHSDTMRRYFQHFGEILEAVVITDKNTGRSKGYGFVTFREPEAAKRACADSAPIIDNRRANCNLASLGRPRSALPSGRLRPVATFFGCAQTTDGSYVGNFGYQQPIPFYQQGFMYPPYEYPPYGTEYIYPQGFGNHYGSQQYLQVYGVPGPVNTAIYPYAAPGAYGYPPVQGYAMSGHQIAQFGGSSVNAIHLPYPAGVTSPLQAPPQLIRPVHSKFVPGGNVDKVVV